MREIKYRGMNNESKEWIYGYYTKLIEGIRIIDSIIAPVDGEFSRFYIHSPKTIGQYTGLKDTNGKEIYEGDIVEIPTGYKFVVEKTWYSMGDYKVFGYSDMGDAEVIGNIYEDGQLLNE